ncbi:MAG: hypothetical protein HKN72_13785 [Gemmatimonadetes bacterium]|nr:hypothetical protein [Gemmatimonadota bacterium]
MGRPMRNGRSTESGAVLVFAVLLALGLLVLGHALLVLAESAYVTSRAHARIVDQGAVVDEALLNALEAGWAPWMDSVPVGRRRTERTGVDGADSTEVTWRRLATEGWLLTARPLARPGGGAAAGRRLVWVMDAAQRMEALPAVVSVGAGAPTLVAGEVSGDTSALGIVGTPALGLLELHAALAQAGALDARGSVAPADAFGACDFSAMWNWGDPGQSSRPCGSFTALRGRVGDLTIDGGQGRVVLFVDGDVTLRAGAAIEGVVVVSGHVRLVEGALFRGRLVAFGGIEVEGGSSVVGSLGAATAALAAVRSSLNARLLLHQARRL